MATLRPNWPTSLPTPEALQMATDAVSQHFAWRETASHPAVVGQAIELAYLLAAYGLVPDEPKPAAAQRALVRETARTKLRPAVRDRAGGTAQYEARGARPRAIG
jgi:hypothetical protein